MQRIERQPAYVLHERAYRETSVLLELLTRDHGRIGLVARGVRSAKPRFSRGTLKSLQALEISWQGRGELCNLTAVDPVGTPLPLAGEGAICALYLNELLTRLLARNDPHPGVFARYSGVLFELAAAEPIEHGWILRRFERDLLEALGYAIDLQRDIDGQPIDPAARYSLDPERGLSAWAQRPLPPAVSGAGVLALAGDLRPSSEQLRELRHLMRALLRHHLGGRELSAWALRLPRAAASVEPPVSDG